MKQINPRTRKEINEEFPVHQDGESISDCQNRLILEVLLDFRDILEDIRRDGESTRSTMDLLDAKLRNRP